GARRYRSAPPAKISRSPTTSTEGAGLLDPRSRARAARLERGIEAEENVVLVREVAGEERPCPVLLFQQIDVELDDGLHVAHEVIAGRESEGAHVDALVD